jgi:hypothetical protein
MEYTYRIATMNINGIAAQIRIRILEEFLHAHDIDLLCVQELTNANIQEVRNYNAHLNIGEGWVTATLVKELYRLGNERYMPSGCEMVAAFNGEQMANISSPSGAGKRKEREDFNTIDVPQLLGHPPSTLLLLVDFNCVLHAQDCTGSPNISSALKFLLTGLKLFDNWDQRSENRQYTH